DRVRGLPASRIDRWKKVICRDGGYQDFEEAVASMLLTDDMLHSAKSQPAKPAPPPTPKSEPKRHTLEAAVDHGAPQAASESLRARKQGAGAPATRPASAPTTVPTASNPAPRPQAVAATKSNAATPSPTR